MNAASGHPESSVAWVDASAGVAGDMLLAALLDAGASISAVQASVDALLPGAIRLQRSTVHRAGMRATRIDVELLDQDPPARNWLSIREQIHSAANLPEPVRQMAHRVFEALAAAEARVHGVSTGQVHFHEVGALDSIADVVGVCAALHDLNVQHLQVGVIAVGSGTVSTQHGQLPVPVPAVLELLRGWPATAGGTGELATPTGVALVTALGQPQSSLPPGVIMATGIGAGTRDIPDRPNVVRVVLLQPLPAADPAATETEAVVLEANVDDLDPRLWPGVIAALLDGGADDAWLTPITMKKGRPAHTLRVLCAPSHREAIASLIFSHTSTIGLRWHPVGKSALERTWVRVTVNDHPVAIKVAHREGRITSATAEFRDVQAVAAATGLPERVVLSRSTAAAEEAGLAAGQDWPTASAAADSRRVCP